jgi:hypothetical protein
MTMAVPPILWEPHADQVAAAAITGFTDLIRARTGLALADPAGFEDFFRSISAVKT